MLKLELLNDRQREAVTYESGNLLVLAGPGSGKTFTIIQRIFYLLEVIKVPPEKILVISFTKDSATELQKRFLDSIIDKHSFAAVVFGTFHSIFYNILRCSSYELSIISYAHKKDIILKLLRQVYQKELADISKAELTALLDAYISAISFYKNTFNLSSSKRILQDKFSDKFQQIYSEYEKYRFSEHLIDFDDMVADCYTMLSDNIFMREEWQARFSYILIDEFQDINPVQYKTVQLLMGRDTAIFAVGDDDQSIYGFRGAEPNSIKNIVEDMQCNIINLTDNYRNPEEIRYFADKVISENISRISKESVSIHKALGERHIFLYGYESRQSHYEAIVKLITQLDSSVAVLFRTNIELQRFSMILSKKGIAYICSDKLPNLYEHFIVKDLIAYLLMSKGDWSYADRVINKPIRYINREALLGPLSADQNIIEYYISNNQKINSKKIIESVNILKKDLSFIKERSLFAAVNYIFNKIGYLSYLYDTVKADDVKYEEYKRIVEWILEDIKAYKDVTEYINAQKDLLDSGKKAEAGKPIDVKFFDKKDFDNKIHLMTVHASKGLEFKHVVIAECNEGNFPHGKLLDSLTTEEERRLFYVAVTRSSQKLYLFYIKGTKERIAIPSRFISFLLDNKYLNEAESNGDC